jgi:small-conductance mechanosensitive channel
MVVVVAGQTIGIILRDLTAGSVMITEGWYKIGDFIKIEPFMEVAGVVERFTLRSTRLRALNGEIIWVHNQNITTIKPLFHKHRSNSQIFIIV